MKQLPGLPPASSQELAVAFFKGKTDNRPVERSLTWDQLKAELTTFMERVVKDGKLFSPVRYKDGPHYRNPREEEPNDSGMILDETGARWRKNDNVESVSCLTLDFDTGLDPADFMASWSGLEYVVHSTHSSTPDNPKWRVVFPLAVPVLAEDWPAVHAKLSEHLAHGAIDPSCKDCSRMYYLPSCPPGADRFTFVGMGRFLDPASVPDLPQEEPEPVVQSTPGSRPGDEFNENATWEDILEPHGWKIDRENYRGQTLWTRPGKDSGVSAKTGPGPNGDRFYCWSSEAGVPHGKALSKFSLFTHLNCAGDYRAAATELGRNRHAVHECHVTTHHGTYSTTRIDEQPVLDESALYGAAGTFVRTVAPHTEAGTPALLFQFLTMAGSVFGRHAYFQVEGARHYPNLFTVIVGTTNAGRKGTSYQHVESVFEQAFSGWSSQCIKTGLGSGEGLIHHVRDPVIKYETDNQDVPVENVIDEGVKDKRLLAFEPEFARVLKVCGRENCTLSAVLRAFWDKGSASTLVKNNPEKASGAHVSMIGHITPQELTSALNDTESANGFGNRILWIHTHRSRLLPNGGDMPIDALLTARDRLQEAVTAAATKGRLMRSSQAELLWIEAYADLSKDAPGLAGVLCARGAPQAMRIALIYALLDGADEIGLNHLEAALAAWKYARDSARYIFGNATGNADADRILAALNEAGDSGVARTQISDLFNKNRDSRTINEALRLLDTNGLARRLPAPPDHESGRPPEIWRAV